MSAYIIHSCFLKIPYFAPDKWNLHQSNALQFTLKLLHIKIFRYFYVEGKDMSQFRPNLNL